MRALVAPAPFKGTLSAAEAARAMAAGLVQVQPDWTLDLAPISDGGDGFLETMIMATGARRQVAVVRGPVHSPVAAAYGLKREPDGVLALIESAQAAGLAHLPPEHFDPLGASSGGVGELMLEARQKGARRFLLGLGGSASTDGGAGLARVLGYRFIDGAGNELAEGGGALVSLDRIDTSGFDPSWMLLPVLVAVDVDNPLLGSLGASRVYGPQKGATPAQVKRLEAGLARLAAVINRDLGIDIAALPGGGAGGGMGAGLRAFLGGQLLPGAELVLDSLQIEKRLAGAGLFLTGEGSLDHQSLRGKAPVVAGRMARRAGVRSVALVGRLGQGWHEAIDEAFDAVVALDDGSDGDAEQQLRLASARLAADL